MDYAANSRQMMMVGADHEILGQAIEEVRRYMFDENVQNWQTELSAFLALVNERLPRHFRYEDETVFPSILAKDTSAFTTQIIQCLNEQHQDLLKDLDQLNALMTTLDQDDPTDVVWRRMQEFIDDLNDHSALEDYFFGRAYPKEAPALVS
jgi:iron-sulfur cluster repair protein YtfE (RIC family)